MKEFTCIVVYLESGTNNEVARKTVYGISKYDIHDKALDGIGIKIYPAQIINAETGELLWHLGEWTKAADRIPITPHYY